MTTAQEALERLREGNQRFTSGVRSVETLASPMRLAELAEGQQPFAIIVGCSDSRVPVETVFDQGLGDLFVVRVAGNIVMPIAIDCCKISGPNCDQDYCDWITANQPNPCSLDDPQAEIEGDRRIHGGTQRRDHRAKIAIASAVIPRWLLGRVTRGPVLGGRRGRPVMAAASVAACNARRLTIAL